MELYSTHSDVRNTDLLDNRGFVVYRITTNSGFTSSGTSTVSRFVPSDKGGAPQPVVVAQIEWHSFKATLLRFRGLSVKESQYIPGRGFVTRTRSFTAASGQSYTWSGNSNVLTIANAQEVARWHNKSSGFFSGNAHAAYVQIAGEAIADLDEVIMTLVYVQGKAREDSNTTTYAIIGASAG